MGLQYQDIDDIKTNDKKNIVARKYITLSTRAKERDESCSTSGSKHENDIESSGNSQVRGFS